MSAAGNGFSDTPRIRREQRKEKQDAMGWRRGLRNVKRNERRSCVQYSAVQSRLVPRSEFGRVWVNSHPNSYLPSTPHAPTPPPPRTPHPRPPQPPPSLDDWTVYIKLKFILNCITTLSMKQSLKSYYYIHALLYNTHWAYCSNIYVTKNIFLFRCP